MLPDMPTFQTDLDTPSLRLSSHMILDGVKLTKLSVTNIKTLSLLPASCYYKEMSEIINL